jgi:UDP-4-amino-4,6-dideoxy-N-acetyl-beta-L-altrosamine N-acetyltransferase
MIQLRDMVAADKDVVRAWRNLPEVAQYMYTGHTISQAEHDKWFASALNNPATKYWIIVVDGRDVGLANLYDINRTHKRCYWAFYIAAGDLRGKGVGSFVEEFVLSYVFEEAGLEKLCCEVLASNDRVAQMHERFGFRREGYLRQHVLKDGTRHDVHTLGILRAEWKQRSA